jgi:CRP/FNR family transcriptional regulator, cyclic AMP receptor protein
MIKPDDITQLPPFSMLSLATRQAIAQRAFIRDYPQGKTLVIEGSPAEYSYFIISGQVRVLRMSEDGRAQVLDRFGPGAPLNIISLQMDTRMNQASVEALTRLKTLVISAEDFDFLLNHYLDFSNLILQIFAQRMVGMTDLAASLSLYSVRARLAKFLIELAELPNTAGGWTQDEIAAHIGTVRDVVGRILRDFTAQGLIERDRQQITLLNRQGLMDIAIQRES